MICLGNGNAKKKGQRRRKESIVYNLELLKGTGK